MAAVVGTPQAGQYVRANGLEIYYEEYGSGQPLLLLYGGTQTHSLWEQHIPILAQHFRVITPDSRGHGKTVNPMSTLSYRMMADDTAALIEALGLEQPLVCGFSDGGRICLEMGTNYPGLAKAYVVNGASYRWSEALLRETKQMGLESPGIVNFERFEQYDPRWVLHLQQQYESWHDILIQISHMWLAPWDHTDEDLRKIGEPTLLLAGDRDDLGLPVEYAVHMYRTIPKAELAIAPNSGHEVRVELFTTLVLDFLLRQRATENSAEEETTTKT
jgi:pimeloyl-ACP methyl ester carboxylesterase